MLTATTGLSSSNVGFTPHRGSAGFDLERDSFGWLEGVDLVGPEKRSFVAEEDRTRELARLLLPRLDGEVQSLEPGGDDAENIIGLHRLGMNHGRIDLRAAGGEDRDDGCHPVRRRGVAREVPPTWVGRGQGAMRTPLWKGLRSLPWLRTPPGVQARVRGGLPWPLRGGRD